ncbi:MAG: helix-turn-helix domain-containing protein [Myxococcota bacterium]
MSISSTVFQGADIAFREATPALRPHVGCFWVLTVRPGATIRLVPEGGAAIQRAVRGEGWTLRGPVLDPAERRYPAAAVLVGVRLRPGVAHAVTGLPADRTVGERLAIGGIEPVPADAPPQRHVDALERFLVARLAEVRVPEVVAAAVAHIERARGDVRVQEVAARCGVSPRHLGRLLRRWVGFGPKRFARVVRFQTTLHALDRAPATPAASLAATHGFADQAHLAREVAGLAGATPRRLASDAASDFFKTRCEEGA